MKKFEAGLGPFILELNRHPLYSKIKSVHELQFFMERHVFAVFDFMSLAKKIQSIFAPVNDLWLPVKNNEIARMINEIVLSEETDHMRDGSVSSHYEMYVKAMDEVGADIGPIKYLIHSLKESGEFQYPVQDFNSVKAFNAFTFDAILNWKPHEIAACFCYGREKIIPHMFQDLLEKLEVSEEVAPTFYYYLNRHIELDGDHHGEMSYDILETLCGDNEVKWSQALTAAQKSIQARIDFWDDIANELELCHMSSYINRKRFNPVDYIFNP